MKTFTIAIPTTADVRAKYNDLRESAKVKAEVRAAKREAKKMVRDFSNKQLNDLAAEIIKSRGL